MEKGFKNMTMGGGDEAGRKDCFFNAKRRERGWFSPFHNSLDEGVSSL
jgi:hypothetical protein